MNMTRYALVAGLAMLGVACTGTNDSMAEDSQTVSTAEEMPFSDDNSAPNTTDSTMTVIDEPVSREDLVVFVAAMEQSLEGTSYEGAILEEPEVYIAAAQTFCARLENGDSIVKVINDYLFELSGTDVSDSLPDDVALVGALIGAGVQTICPSQTGVL